ncbi:MAG: hypothetical protein H0W13_05210 [Nitrospirales bacterium]|nr:hypothetical protein [Nitrospirales bacterium]
MGKTKIPVAHRYRPDERIQLPWKDTECNPIDGRYANPAALVDMITIVEERFRPNTTKRPDKPATSAFPQKKK